MRLGHAIINTRLPVKDDKAGVLTPEFDRFLEQVEYRNLSGNFTYSEINLLVLNPGSYLTGSHYSCLGQNFPTES